VSGAERIAGAFAKPDRRAALMPYLMGGFPTLDAARRIGAAYVAGGADLIELGVPFSDPLADGPVIHAAGVTALAAGARVETVLELGAELSSAVPVVVMCYANLVFAHGAEAFATGLAQAGVSGLIVPDLPLEEASPVRDACDAAGVALVPLVAPTTPDERFAAIGAQARGFLYAVSVVGTTGERADGDVSAVVDRARSNTAVPVAVGFGIATPERAAEAAAAGADGVIVGSRLVRAVADGEDVEALVRDFSAALTR